MMNLLLTDDIRPYQPVLEQPITAMRCKHVLGIRSPKSRELWERSQEAGYPEALWGYGSGIAKDPDANRIAQSYTVRRMVHKRWTAPFRLVIDRTGTPWVDNLHSAIRDILVFGDSVRPMDVGCYIIDLAGGVPVAVDVCGSLSTDLAAVKGAVSCARKRDARATDAVRGVGYTIGEFLSENGISRKSVGPSAKQYDAYLIQFLVSRKGA